MMKRRLGNTLTETVIQNTMYVNKNDVYKAKFFINNSTIDCLKKIKLELVYKHRYIYFSNLLYICNSPIRY